ncbi:enoyl-CoA hydratase [Paracidovorax avenae]|uniref:enoyl-CoA hydratase n=1 Tax=Paracidovorax avenae TaxID=80867 RepID=UPI0006B38B3B
MTGPAASMPASAADAPVLHTTRDARGVVTLTLADPARLNALGDGMLTALQQALDAVAQDPQARVVVLAAQGKAFCAGHDLKDMAAHPDAAWYQRLFAQCSRMMVSIQRLPVPVIARVQGIATAAGCQLVAQCDLAVAAEGARFATSGIHYGLFCATPSVPLVRNVPAKRAMEMLLTGDFIDARTALAEGLVNRVVPPEALDAEIESLVRSILEKPRAAVAMGKALFYQQRELGVEAAYQLAGQAMATNMMDGAAQEGARAFAEKRAPAWKAAAGAPLPPPAGT